MQGDIFLVKTTLQRTKGYALKGSQLSTLLTPFEIHHPISTQKSQVLFMRFNSGVPKIFYSFIGTSRQQLEVYRRENYRAFSVKRPVVFTISEQHINRGKVVMEEAWMKRCRQGAD